MVHLVGGVAQEQQTPIGEELESALELEQHCAQTLTCIVDCTVYGLRNDKRLTRTTAEVLIATARDAALDLFPSSEASYNLLLAPRFTRLLEERFGADTKRQPARILAFRPRPQPSVPPSVQAPAMGVELAVGWAYAATES
jgi:hypothetical protein